MLQVCVFKVSFFFFGLLISQSVLQQKTKSFFFFFGRNFIIQIKFQARFDFDVEGDGEE